MIAATYSGAVGEAQRTVSVFPGTPPLPTDEIFGVVTEAGKTSATGGISGAVVEVLNGLIAGDGDQRQFA